jgi:hypothetical protein
VCAPTHLGREAAAGRAPVRAEVDANSIKSSKHVCGWPLAVGSQQCVAKEGDKVGGSHLADCVVARCCVCVVGRVWAGCVGGAEMGGLRSERDCVVVRFHARSACEGCERPGDGEVGVGVAFSFTKCCVSHSAVWGNVRFWDVHEYSYGMLESIVAF